jgi:hypothetical protein
MRTKGLIGLLAVTAAAVIVAVVLSMGGGAPAADPLAGTPVLPQVGKQLDAVGRIALVRGETKTTLVHKGKSWVVEEKDGYAADPIKVRHALLGLAELRYVEPKTRKPALYSRLEVEDTGKAGSKSTLVTVADEKGSLLGEIIAGKRRADQLGGGNDGIYVRKPGNQQSWLARGTLDVSGDTTAWLDRKVLDLPEAQVKEAVLTGPDGATVTILRDKAQDKFHLADLPAGKKLKSDDALDEPAAALANLELTDVEPAKDVELPQDGVAHARYTSFDGLTVTVDLFDKDGGHWARLAASGSGAAEKKAAALNAKLAPWIYGIADYKAKTLRTKLGDLIESPKGS